MMRITRQPMYYSLSIRKQLAKQASSANGVFVFVGISKGQLQACCFSSMKATLAFVEAESELALSFVF
jgi:hypothetical protein